MLLRARPIRIARGRALQEIVEQSRLPSQPAGFYEVRLKWWAAWIAYGPAVKMTSHLGRGGDGRP